jgi:hypothetical protein
MYFDPTLYGYGLGLVMLGWIAGMAMGFVFKLFRSVDRLV